jgi:hypothetical protein
MSFNSEMLDELVAARLSLNALGVEHGLNGDDNFHDAVRSVSTLAAALGCDVTYLCKLVDEEEAARSAS